MEATRSGKSLKAILTANITYRSMKYIDLDIRYAFKMMKDQLTFIMSARDVQDICTHMNLPSLMKCKLGGPIYLFNTLHFSGLIKETNVDFLLEALKRAKLVEAVKIVEQYIEKTDGERVPNGLLWDVACSFQKDDMEPFFTGKLGIQPAVYKRLKQDMDTNYTFYFEMLRQWRETLGHRATISHLRQLLEGNEPYKHSITCIEKYEIKRRYGARDLVDGRSADDFIKTVGGKLALIVDEACVLKIANSLETGNQSEIQRSPQPVITLLNLLREQKKLNINKLKETLEQMELVTAVEIIDTWKKRTTDGPYNYDQIKILSQGQKDNYLHQAKHFFTLGQQTEKDLEKIYTDISVFRKIKGNKIKEYECLQSYEGIFKIEGKRWWLHGNAGCGKTTLTKRLSETWAKGQILRNITLFFHLCMRDAGNEYTFAEAIIKSFSPKGWKLKAADLERMITELHSRVFIVLDGYDELQREKVAVKLAPDIRNIAEGRKFPHALVLITDRASIHTVKEDDENEIIKHLEIKGFSPDNVAQYIAKVSRSETHQERAMKLIKPVDNTKRNLPFDIARVPLLVSMICDATEETSGAFQNKMSLYDLFLYFQTFLHHRYFQKRQANKKPSVNLNELLDKLGSFAFSELLKEKYVWEEREIEQEVGTRIVKIATKMGLLRKIRKENHAYSYIHKLFHEHNAAWYVSKSNDPQKKDGCMLEQVWRAKCFQEDPHSFKNFLRFLSGADTAMAMKVLLRLKKISNSEELIAECLYEVDVAYEKAEDTLTKEESVRQTLRSLRCLRVFGDEMAPVYMCALRYLQRIEVKAEITLTFYKCSFSAIKEVCCAGKGLIKALCINEVSSSEFNIDVIPIQQELQMLNVRSEDIKLYDIERFLIWASVHQKVDVIEFVTKPLILGHFTKTGKEDLRGFKFRAFLRDLNGDIYILEETLDWKQIDNRKYFEEIVINSCGVADVQDMRQCLEFRWKMLKTIYSPKDLKQITEELIKKKSNQEILQQSNEPPAIETATETMKRQRADDSQGSLASEGNIPQQKKHKQSHKSKKETDLQKLKRLESEAYGQLREIVPDAALSVLAKETCDVIQFVRQYLKLTEADINTCEKNESDYQDRKYKMFLCWKRNKQSRAKGLTMLNYLKKARIEIRAQMLFVKAHI